MSYRNVDNFQVIGADGRDPATSFRNHRARGSQGGVDVVAPFRTPVHAPDDCTIYLAPNNGTGGNTATLVYGDGWSDQMMHLDEFVLQDGRAPRNGLKLRQFEQFALSGRSGEKGRYTYDPHVHWHRQGPSRRDQWGTTNRYNPWDYFTALAGGPLTPLPLPKEIDMTGPAIVWTAQHGIYSVIPGVVVCHPDAWWTDILKNPAAKIPGDDAVIRVGGPDLLKTLFVLGGMPADQLPRAGYIWRADAGVQPAYLDVDEGEVARLLLPSLTAALSDVATNEDLQQVKHDLIATIATVDDDLIASFGLKRA